MKKVQLTSICKPKQWKTIPTSELMKEGYPVYGANGIIGYYNEYNHGDRTIAITCRGATCGTVNMTVPKSYITGNAMCLDEVSDEIDIDYLFYVMQAYDFKKVISGTAQPQITREGLSKVEVVVYPKDKQTEVVKRIGIIESAIANAKTRIALLDDLVKSRFVEMFGDPIENPRGWPYETMKSICTKITDGEHGSVARSEEGHPFLNAKHIKTSGDIEWDSVTFTSDEVHERIYKRCNPEADDIIMTTTGTIGNVAVVPKDREPFTMDRGITLLKLDRNRVKALYIAWLLRQDAIQSIMNANVHASAIGHLFLNKVEQIPVMMPDMWLQDEFSSFVAQTDKSKLAVQKELEKLEILKKSLMQQYFG